MAWRFNPPPGWPAAPAGWLPPAGWQPDASWPPAPSGWQLLVEDGGPGTAPNLPVTAVADARIVAHERANTHHYSSRNLTVSTSVGADNVAVGGSTAADPIEQLRRLGELRDLGIVTEEEFAAKKAEILSRL